MADGSRVARFGRWWTAGFVLSSVLFGFVIAYAPQALVVLLIGLVVFAAIAPMVLARPVWLLYFIILTSAVAGLLSVADTGQFAGGISLSGLRWLFVAGMAAFVLFVNLRAVRINRSAWVFLPWIAWVAVRFALTPLGMNGLKDVLFFAMPALVSAYTYFVMRTDTAHVSRTLERMIAASVVIPLLVYVVLFATGKVTFTERGPWGLIAPRVVALYLNIIVCIGLARIRYGATRAERQTGIVITAVAVFTILATLSRTSSATALAIVAGSRIDPRKPWRLVLAVVLFVALLWTLIWEVPYFRQRMFFKTGPTLISSLQYFNTAGRIDMWPIVAADALRSPVIGSGPGSARVILAKLNPGAGDEDQYPHNEYLLVFHDQGMVGEILFLFAWATLVVTVWRAWARAVNRDDAFAAKWNLTALLAIAVLLFTAVTGNTLHYMFAMTPAFILLGLRDYWVGQKSAFPTAA